jgi:hypothetical protein
MKLAKAIKILKKHQQWCLMAEIPIEPRKTAEAINIVLYAVELQQRYIKSGEIGDFEELKKL